MEDVSLNSPIGQPVNKEEPQQPELSGDETPDPRIQIELECLNTSTDTINKLEVDLDEARMQFRQLLLDSTQKIDALAKRLGKTVDQSRPYYEARIKAKQALSESQKAAVRFERAMSQHAAAREMVFLAEEGLLQKGCIFDATWQEMLNHATSKVNDAEKEKIESASDHRQTSAAFHEAETRVKSLQKDLKRSIAKSSLNARRSLLQLNNLVRMHQLQMLPYFELKASVNHQLENQKHRVKELEDSVIQAKNTYSEALSNLETISNEIHRTRQCQIELGVRGVGVGAEFPGPSHTDDSDLIKMPHDEASLRHTVRHYTSQTLAVSQDAGEGEEEFKSLPSKLGSAASPLIASSVSEEFLISSMTGGNAAAASLEACDYRNSISQDSVDLFAKCNIHGQDSRNNMHEYEKEDTKTVQNSSFMTWSANQVECAAQSSLDMYQDTEVEAVETSTEFSGWQVVGVANPSLPSSHLYLTVEDKDYILSDTESLASIEMLGDSAIAGLMLEEELAEASVAMSSGTPLTTPCGDNQLKLQPDQECNDVSPFGRIKLQGETSEERAVQLRASLMTLQQEKSEYLTKTDTNIASSISRPETLDLEFCGLESESSSSPEAASASASTPATPGYAPLKNTPNSPDSYEGSKSFEVFQ